jgi:hypothetical protein
MNFHKSVNSNKLLGYSLNLTYIGWFVFYPCQPCLQTSHCLSSVVQKLFVDVCVLYFFHPIMISKRDATLLAAES